MLYKLNLEHILFLDIETVPQHQHFTDLDENGQHLWEQKHNINVRMNSPLRNFTAGPEFGPNLGRSYVYLLVILPIKET